MKDGIRIVENILWAEGPLKVSPAVFNKFQSQFLRYNLDELRFQIGAAVTTIKLHLAFSRIEIEGENEGII